MYPWVDVELWNEASADTPTVSAGATLDELDAAIALLLVGLDIARVRAAEYRPSWLVATVGRVALEVFGAYCWALVEIGDRLPAPTVRRLFRHKRN